MVLEEVLITFVLTVIGGVLIYTLGQIFLKFFIEPVHELLKVIGNIGDTLVFYAQIYGNSGLDDERYREAKKELRRDASLLKSRAQVVKWYRLFSILRFPMTSVLSTSNWAKSS